MIVVRSTLAALLLLGGTLSALADPPGRVGRLSYMEGTVSFHAGDQDQWTAAVLNYPVTTGTAFWTEPGSRAEIQIGGAEVRLDQSTELDIVSLDDEGTRLHVSQGVVNVHLRAAPSGRIRIVTPNSEADLLVAGSYRIDAGVAPVPERVQIVVLEGEARINEPRASLDILPGESAVIGGDPVTFTLVEASTTPFDDWALQRERREVISESARYVSPDVTGYEDLDRNGQWRTGPNRDAVWYPTAMPSGWAPYRDGHWAYVQPWGWTWVDDASWGFAPFHYGRWVNDDRGWGWHPGERIAQPVYAPALVAFIGGAGFGVSLSVGRAPAVGWIPLAPTELFRPYYPASVNYVRNVNTNNVSRATINTITVTNTTNTTITNTTVNHYLNRQAATVVPTAVFTRAAPVQHATLALPKEQLAQVAVTAQVDHLQPTHAARAGRAQPAAIPVVPGPNTPATIMKGPVVAPTAPAAVAAVAADPPAPKAPGPVISATRPRPGATPAATAPLAGATEPPAHGRPTARGAPAPSTAATTPVPSQAIPIAPAAPGPPIARPGAPASAPPPAIVPTAPATATAAPSPAPSAAPGPPIAHAIPAPVTASAPPQAAPQSSRPAHVPGADRPPVASAPPPIGHAQPAAPIPAAPPPAAAAAPPQVAVHAPPVILHPEQKTQIAPTPNGWVRSPPSAPAAPQAQPAHVVVPPPAPPAAPVQPAHVAPPPAPAAPPVQPVRVAPPPPPAAPPVQPAHVAPPAPPAAAPAPPSAAQHGDPEKRSERARDKDKP